MLLCLLLLVDEKLYSRQLYVMGHERSVTLMASNALLIVSWFGVEVAKNCSGIHSRFAILSVRSRANFLLSESLVERRVRRCKRRLAQLQSVPCKWRMPTYPNCRPMLYLPLIDGMSVVW
jgi:hypothetical protein